MCALVREQDNDRSLKARIYPERADITQNTTLSIEGKDINYSCRLKKMLKVDGVTSDLLSKEYAGTSSMTLKVLD